jgi:hypothetical protein
MTTAGLNALGNELIMKPNIFAAALLIVGCANAQTADLPRTPVTDARALLLAAIDAPGGAAHGTLIGSIAEAITQRFHATSPIYIDVTTVRRYAQAGCSRLKVTYWQEGVQLPGAPSPRKQTIDMELNYCRDGLPPRSLS